MPHGPASIPAADATPLPPQPRLSVVALVAVALPALIAFNLPPSATFFNQATALIGWGAFLALLAVVLPNTRRLPSGGLLALHGALAVLLLSALTAPLWTGQPWALALSSVGLIAAAALAAQVGASAQRAGHGWAAFHAFCIGLLVAGVGSSLIAVIQVLAPSWADGTWIARSGIEGRAVGNLRQPNHLSSLLLWALVAVAWLGEVGRLRRPAATGLMALMLFALVLSASRTGMVGAVMLALWGGLDRRLSASTRRLLWLVPVFYVVFWAGITGWAHFQQQVFGGEAQLHKADISSSRFGIWSNTLSLIAAHPWAGVGWGEFNFAWTLTPFPGRPVAFFDHTHNLPLQFAVELGLPLAALALTLLSIAVVAAVQAARRAVGDDASPLRAALVMVLLVIVHSQLEYPLWYAYFLLPAAFALGLCLGGPASAEPAAAPAPGRTRPLLLGAMLLLVGGLVSVQDYLRVVAIFAPSEDAAPLPQRIADGQRSWFFSHHGDYAAGTTPEHPSEAMNAFIGAPHFLLDARLMMAWAKALDESGDTDRARYVAQRLKEFRNEQADEFFAPCKAEPASGQALPFQCQQPTRSLGYADFR